FLPLCSFGGLKAIQLQCPGYHVAYCGIVVDHQYNRVMTIACTVLLVHTPSLIFRASLLSEMSYSFFFLNRPFVDARCRDPLYRVRCTPAAGAPFMAPACKTPDRAGGAIPPREDG